MKRPPPPKRTFQQWQKIIQKKALKKGGSENRQLNIVFLGLSRLKLSDLKALTTDVNLNSLSSLYNFKILSGTLTMIYSRYYSITDEMEELQIKMKTDI